MNFIHVNSSKPTAAQVALSQFDDEFVLLPLDPATQKAWSKRAVLNRPKRAPKLQPALN